MMEQEIQKPTIDSIVKAIDDNTKKTTKQTTKFLYSLKLLYVEYIEGNLYNIKFLANTFDSNSNEKVYYNLHILVNDRSAIEKSKYFADTEDKKKVKILLFGPPSTPDNNYRIDLTLDPSDNGFIKMAIVLIKDNILQYIYLNKELFFTLNIFEYNLMLYNFIDTQIINTIDLELKSKLHYDAEFKRLYMNDNIKNFTFHWNDEYIIACMYPKASHKRIQDLGLPVDIPQRNMYILVYISLHDKEYVKFLSKLEN